MPNFCTESSLTMQTAYAQMLDAGCCIERQTGAVGGRPAGSFNAKSVKGRKYWYFQYTAPSGKLRQIYVGPDAEPGDRLKARKGRSGASAALGPLARTALALGCTAVLPRHYRVVRRLADYGFFDAGGVLICTHAFLPYGNMLGLRWGGQDRPRDIDLAHAGKALALALPNNLVVKIDEAIVSLARGFLPMSGLTGKAAGSNLIPAEPDFRLDFLTPLHRGGDTPYVHPQLNVPVQPLPFMELSLEHVERAVVFCSEGAVLVNVPAPERYALHKLLVFGERSGTFRAKSNKDLAQAAHLLAYLWERCREPLHEALQDLMSRGKGWVARLRQGAQALNKAYPHLPAGDWRLAAPKRAR